MGRRIGGGGAGAAAGGAKFADADEAVEVADAAGGFDLDFGRAVGAHEFEVVVSGALIVVVAVGLFGESVAGAGFDVVGAGGFGDLAEADFYFVVGEEIVFENDFEDGAIGVGGFADGADVGFDIGPIGGEGFADVE